MYISTFADLASFCERASAFPAVAVDTEFLREKTYHPKLCLIQVATPEECVAIDPLALDDLSPLCALMGDPSTVKVFHACSQDMEVMLHTLGVLPAPMFDTQVAAAFLGERVQVSYNGLVQTFCGVSLPKSESLTDWSRRPLTPEQLDYALDDVRWLIKAYDVIVDKLQELGRLSWVMDELGPLADRSHYEVDYRTVFKRVKRIGSLTRSQLAVARELAAWREQQAERRDVPRKWVMSDEVLLALSKRAPRTEEELRRMRGTESLSSSAARGAVKACERGLACPSDRLPFLPRPHRANALELESVVDLMYALMRLVSERSGVATALIASRDDLLEYVDHPQDSPLRDGWRFELVGTLMDDLLQGNIGLTVKDRTIEIL